MPLNRYLFAIAANNAFNTLQPKIHFHADKTSLIQIVILKLPPSVF